MGCINAIITLWLTTVSFASSVSAASSICGLTVTCINTATTFPACSAKETADFALVSTSLQACKDVSYYFTDGQTWPINDKKTMCATDSVCGKLVPYIRNTEYLVNVCASFGPYANTIATFRDYCRGEPIQESTDDQGLLRDLQNGITTKPTPAPTNNNNYRIETIPPNDATTRSNAIRTISPSILLAVGTAVAVVVGSS